MRPLWINARPLSSPAVVGALLAVAVGMALGALRCRAGDLGHVPLFDGERWDALNLWGGPFVAGSGATYGVQSSVVRTGVRAYQYNLGSLPNDGTRVVQTLSSAVGGASTRQDRDLTQYQTLEGYVRNDAPVPLNFTLMLSDYRFNPNHRASRTYTIPADGAWTKIEAPLDLTSGWTVTGSPDLKRTFALALQVDADFGAASGSLYLDDFALKETGPSIDVATAPIEAIVERLAHRQFQALWAARGKSTGIVPNTSNSVIVGALNTTTGMLWNLPAAIRRGWVSQSEADAAVGQVVAALNVNRDRTTYLPTRFLDYATGLPTSNEESPIDAAFIALALHNYKSQPATPVALRDSISALENRMDFAAFARPAGFSLGYGPGGFNNFSYSGYTNENKVITLAAQLANGLPLAGEWNKDTGRVLASLVDPNQEFLTYSFSTEYRAPFAQALLNLFVDTSERGVDNYPDRTLARNPWINFARYEDEISSKLQQLGRDNFFQPDAARGPDPVAPPPAITYEAWNLFNDFGQPDVFQPWSVAEALLAGAPGAEEALRFLLDNGLGTGLDGPLGLADWAEWTTGAANPANVPSAADNWNMALSTMAMMNWLDGEESANRFFANLPEVKAALDTVFLDGDLNGSGATTGSDFALWRSGFGTAVRANPAGGDADGDGDADGADFLRWQRGFGGTTAASAAGKTVPEPGSLGLGALAAIVVSFWGKKGGGRWQPIRGKKVLKALARLASRL